MNDNTHNKGKDQPSLKIDRNDLSENSNETNHILIRTNLSEKGGI
jgi:hypothetical protein